MELYNYVNSEGWRTVGIETIPAREAQHRDLGGLDLSKASSAYLKEAAPAGLYLHQWKAIQKFLEGKNVCLATGTASGKSLTFYIAGIEKLIRNPHARILAMYPLKALGQEQEQRWRKALRAAGLDAEVGRLDGQVPMAKRSEIIRGRRVLVATPDVVHAWLLLNISDRGVSDFLRHCSLVIVDEVHTYTGVFGSNSAYLFRRLRHAMALLGNSPQYIAASATISRPEAHLENLTGVRFTLIGEDLDTSPRRSLTIRLVEPPASGDLLTNITRLMEFVARKTSHRFLAFVDSRKRTEYIAAILSRAQDEDAEEALSPAAGAGMPFDRDHLLKLSILPYRAGYEEYDRTLIQDRLSRGELTGVVCTSALELGIDIPHLTLGVLVGVPPSATSFYQRIGRIGRHADGEIIVINTGDFYSESIFREPHRLLKLPLSEGALYLENRRIQGIHALCLARHGGEHDQISGSPEEAGFKSPIAWPVSFIELCDSLRMGNVPQDLQEMMIQSGEDPNHAFPLRDVDIQFQIESTRGGVRENMGTLSFDQLMREAYPGAVYYYTTKPYRVCRVKVRERRVEVRRERHYITRPEKPPVMVFPNLTSGNIYQSYQYGGLIAAECNLQIRESITGFREKRGPQESRYSYPLDQSLGFFFDQPRFTRNVFTTGVVLSHPALNAPNTQIETIAELLFEIFLMVIPFERRDIHFAVGRHRIKCGPIKQGDRFICVYDQTYGSLRLSSRMLDRPVFHEIIKKAAETGTDPERFAISLETREALEALACAVDAEPTSFAVLEDEGSPADASRYQRVLKPGSLGLNTRRDNMEFKVDAVFFNPREGTLCYRGRYVLETADRYNGMITAVPVEAIESVPGESEFCFYDLESGEILTADQVPSG